MFAFALTLALGAAAATEAPAPRRPATLRWEPRVDLPVTGALLAGWVGTELAKPALAPAACRWCEPNAFDTAVRRAFNPSLSPSASGVGPVATASDLTGFVGLPLTMLGLDALLSWRDGTLLETMPVDVVLVAEATFGALAVTQLTKFLVARARPYSIDAGADLLAGGRDPNDARLSFFSGHTSFSFALATSAATVMTLRGYRHAWVAWVVGMPLAAATAVLRLAADKHWASDVLVGMAVGAGLGAGIPLLFHGRVSPSTSLRALPMPNGVALAGSF
jgi:membrane-associated phospholipid phosphatase